MNEILYHNKLLVDCSKEELIKCIKQLKRENNIIWKKAFDSQQVNLINAKVNLKE